MADQPEQHEKTEEPTQKKLDDAHKKGDVAKSQEVTSWFIMIGALLVLIIFSQDMGADLTAVLKILLSEAHQIPTDGGALVENLRRLGVVILGALAFPLIIFMAAGLAGNLFQHKMLFSLEPVTPKLSKVSPLAGFKRLFSKTSVVNFAKSMAKLAIVSLVIIVIIWPNRDRLDAIMGLDPTALMTVTHTMAVQVMIGVVAVFTVIAALDLAWQKHTWWEKQRMTVKELRDEFKQMEGDPQVRAKLRQIRVERGKQRMMQNVPRAAVVITNPTHYSIALEYEQGMDAPVCVAKGVDSVALKIRELAEEHNIPIVENPPLARTLHASVEIDGAIPAEHFKAVAEVIG
ncbi:MAG TPA: flagellar biosynthesis protein FlhB, partial [Rhizobiales bacterium]|nr:flagellar biosynthesis protein FlhB [Hyphomicrobiales bacterium]